MDTMQQLTFEEAELVRQIRRQALVAAQVRVFLLPSAFSLAWSCVRDG